VYASQGQEAFIEGHVEAFRVLGGVATDKIRYDNLRSAVSRVLFGRNRTESDRWVAFRSHTGFDVFYCNPGIEGAHEKGGVEGEVGRFRRNHLVPVPVVDTLSELNARLKLDDVADDGRRIENRVRTVGQDFAVEAPLLRPLPAEPFDAGLWLTPRVDRYSRVTVRQCHYSVPAALIGRNVRVSLRASELVIFDGRRQVARHSRIVRKGDQALVLDHYLEVLVRKPGALPGATALVQARESGVLPPSTRRSGPRPGPRTVTAGAPGPWWKSCCCTVTSPTPTWLPPWPWWCPWAPPLLMWSRSRPARSPPPTPPFPWTATVIETERRFLG